MVKLTAPKRTKKSLTAENYWAEKTKNQKNEDSKPAPKKENIDRRYHFVRPSEKMEKMDVNVAHYINEINILPYSHTVDSIGKFQSISYPQRLILL